MGVAFVVVNDGNNPNKLEILTTFALGDGAASRDIALDVDGTGQNIALRSVLLEAVADDATARARLGLRSLAADPVDNRIVVKMVTLTAGIPPAVEAVRDAGTGRAFLRITPAAALAGVVAASPTKITFELDPTNQRRDGGTI